MKKLIIFLFIITFSLFFSKVGSSSEGVPSTSQGVLIRVTNKSDKLLSPIKLFYTGGSHTIPILKENEMFQFYVNPTSESAIELEFYEEQNKKIKVSIDTYFEPNYAGSLFVFIYNDGKVTWEDNIVIAP